MRSRTLAVMRCGRYMMETTTKKVDIIDPTGRSLRIDPSQVEPPSHTTHTHTHYRPSSA
jgi:hypothetical protein